MSLYLLYGWSTTTQVYALVCAVSYEAACVELAQATQCSSLIIQGQHSHSLSDEQEKLLGVVASTVPVVLWMREGSAT